MISLEHWTDKELLALFAGNTLDNYKPLESIKINYELVKRLTQLMTDYEVMGEVEGVYIDEKTKTLEAHLETLGNIQSNLKDLKHHRFNPDDMAEAIDDLIEFIG